MGVPPLGKGLGYVGLEIDSAGMVAFHAGKLVTALEHAVEFIDQH